MLKLYHKKLSLYSRPVWIALLEKQLSFQSVELALDGDQWQPEFLAINPFGRVPVLVDNDFAVFESLIILDYLPINDYYSEECVIIQDVTPKTFKPHFTPKC